MPAIGLVDPNLSFFVAQQIRSDHKAGKVSTLGLIHAVWRSDAAVSVGLDMERVEKGKDFMVQFPSVEKLSMLMDFEEFKLKLTNAYMKVASATKSVSPKGRLFTVWSRAEGVPEEMKHYKGICEIGSLIGAVDDVDMQILPDLDVVRFQVDVRRIKKFPMVKEFTVKPWLYDIMFSIEKVVEMGTFEENANVPMETDEARRIREESEVTKSKAQEGDMDEEKARATKKLNSQDASTSREEILEVIMAKNGTVVIPEFEKVITFRNIHYEKLPQLEKYKVIAHKLQHVENKELLRKKAEQDLPSEEDENKKEVADTSDDEMDEELVDFEDSQDRQLEQQEDEDDWPESQESFGTKVGKITGEGVKEKSGKQEKSNKMESSTEEPRIGDAPDREVGKMLIEMK
jgi:hypothetical protein